MTSGGLDNQGLFARQSIENPLDGMTTDVERRETERKAKNAERQRKWRAANPQSPEQKAKAAKRSRKWRQANSARSKAHQKAWREANADKVKSYSREWNAAKRKQMRAAKKQAKQGNPPES